MNISNGGWKEFNSWVDNLRTAHTSGSWSSCRPPYSVRQRKYVCFIIPAYFDACAGVLPFVTAIST